MQRAAARARPPQPHLHVRRPPPPRPRREPPHGRRMGVLGRPWLAPGGRARAGRGRAPSDYRRASPPRPQGWKTGAKPIACGSGPIVMPRLAPGARALSSGARLRHPTQCRRRRCPPARPRPRIRARPRRPAPAAGVCAATLPAPARRPSRRPWRPPRHHGGSGAACPPGRWRQPAERARQQSPARASALAPLHTTFSAALPFYRRPVPAKCWSKAGQSRTRLAPAMRPLGLA
jgi:hypothetical protein